MAGRPPLPILSPLGSPMNSPPTSPGGNLPVRQRLWQRRLNRNQEPPPLALNKQPQFSSPAQVEQAGTPPVAPVVDFDDKDPANLDIDRGAWPIVSGLGTYACLAMGVAMLLNGVFTPNFAELTPPTVDPIAWMWWATLSLISLFHLRNLKTLWSVNPSHPFLLQVTIFTWVCAFRSFVPRVDAERLCFFPLTISWPFWGRLGATLAEISFAYVLSRVWIKVVNAQHAFNPVFNALVGNAVLLLCSAAQVMCWLGVLTTNNYYHAVEESMWAIAFALLALATFLALVTAPVNHQGRACFMAHTTWISSLYVVYMVQLDIPLYLNKFQNQEESGWTYLTLNEGLWDSMSCTHVTQASFVWIPEMLWLTGYFAGTVWLLQHIISKKDLDIEF